MENQLQRSNDSNKKARSCYPNVVLGNTLYSNIVQKAKNIEVLGDKNIEEIRKKEFNKCIKVNAYVHSFIL